MPWSPSISVGRLTTSGREPAELSLQQINFSLSTEMPKNLSDCMARPKEYRWARLGNDHNVLYKARCRKGVAPLASL